MRLKQVSKRRWKARLLLGLWIPRQVIERWSLTAPKGDKLVWHPGEDFVTIWPADMKHYTPDYQPVKRAWE
jgi:hypothetical protein